MKKIIPIVTMLGASALIVGLSLSPAEEKKENYIKNINAFKNEVAKYASVNNTDLTATALNKYTLSFQENLDDVLNQNISTVNDNIDGEINENLQVTKNSQTLLGTTEESENLPENYETEYNTDEFENNISEQENNTTQEKISTLYSLSSDISASCDDFCELKEDITEAIIETQNLINKVQQKEIELTSEQRMFITEQAQQLKSLGRQLSNITTELSFNLSDLNQIMTTNSHDIDNLSLKYLVVLDNLVNGNEMLQSGLSSLNLINQMFNMNTKNIPSNNQGRVLYGFRHNDNPPVIKDYYIDENGNMVENNQEDSNSGNEIEENQTDNNAMQVNEDKNNNIDTYKNTKLNSNLDTYHSNNIPRNIDSFFNTALLDNEFMYGSGNYGYGMNSMYGVNNPYINGYANNEQNRINSVENKYTTQDNVVKNSTKQSNKEKKRIQLKKNIDTFKDENEPDIKTKLGNIKNSITGFFQKFKASDLDDKIENPVYRFNAKDIEN